MKSFLFIWSILATIIAIGVMSYITMATSIGPWIETVIVLLGIILVKILKPHPEGRTHILGLSTATAGMGGIIATACGFSFPTLYFLDPILFNSWMQNPLYFCFIMGSLVFVAGILGLLVAQVAEPSMLSNPKMNFSVGQLVEKMIAAQAQVRKAYELLAGMATSVLLFFVQHIAHISNTFTLLPRISCGIIRMQPLCIKLDLFPMFLAIGFVAGSVLTVPLIVGILSKIFILEPLHKLAFNNISSENVLLAFCSGLVLQSALMSFIDIPVFVRWTVKWFKEKSKFTTHKTALQDIPWYILLLSAAMLIAFLSYFNFSLIAQAYLIIGSIICIYQILIIAGEIGLAPLGRYATFVMVPGLLIFGFNAIQATLVATFVEVACGTAADALFGRKMAQLAHIDRKSVMVYQLLGLVVSALSIGIIFFLLIKHFGLGSTELFAPRAQSRALLINSYNFNYMLLVLGGLYGFVLKHFKVNPILVLGGIAMSIDVSLMLIIGGVAAMYTKDPEEWYPYWSGVFVASSLIMILKAIF